MNRASVTLYAMALSAAGVPLYIHLPRYAQVELGLSLSVVGAVLIGIRVLDFVQDPALGWMVDRWPAARARFAAWAAAGLGLGFVALFTVPPVFEAAAWMTVVLVVIFTCYSLATILFYSQTRALSGSDGTAALVRVGLWREAGTLFGIVLAAALPTLLGYRAFGLVLFCAVLAASLAVAPIWALPAPPLARLSLGGLADSGGLWLLALALVNSLPVAMTSTLFLFFVEDALQVAGQAGLYLILFVLSAGLSVPLWSRLAGGAGMRNVLLGAMALAIACFAWAALLPAGAALAFALICIGSGMATGADILLLPVLFAGVLSRAGLQAGQAFGLWAFAGKLSLAVAAATVLPLLDAAGFRAGEVNSAQAIDRLTLLYAVLPLGLKALAIATVLILPRKVFLP